MRIYTHTHMHTHTHTHIHTHIELAYTHNSAHMSGLAKIMCVAPPPGHWQMCAQAQTHANTRAHTHTRTHAHTHTHTHTCTPNFTHRSGLAGFMCALPFAVHRCSRY